jgi:NADH:ubiquinone oxidoreductase subunit C
VSEVLAHRSRALTPDETEALLRDRLGDGVQRAVVAAGVFTLWIDPSAWVEAATRCRDERLLAYDMFDVLFGVDAREEGFDVVAVLYSTSTGNRIALRARCEGGREAPSLPSLSEVYRGANWMERETYDMFGIDFGGHPGLEPRILTVENFEGWPLRKDFHLAARVAKPWPGVAEPVELDEDGNVIEREVGIGDAPGPYELDKAMAAQAKQVNAPPVPAEDTGDAASADDGGAGTGAGDASAEVAASATATGPTVDAPVDEDRAARAKAKAEERRRKQAEARAAKAQARAARVAGGDAPAGPDEAGGATDTAADAGGAAGAVAPPDTGAGSTPADAPETDAAAQADAPETDAAAAPTDAKAKAEERRRMQAEAREARAAARAAKAGGASPAEGATDATGDEDATSTSTDAAPDGAPSADAGSEDAVAEDEPSSDESEASAAAPDTDDRAARAKAKAEERRRKQAELRAARAKARAERTEATEDGEDDA